jgi:GDP-L-fucose synthase
MRKVTDVSKIHNFGWKNRVDIEEEKYKLYNWYLSKQNE